jgi:hypothetical protein
MQEVTEALEPSAESAAGTGLDNLLESLSLNWTHVEAVPRHRAREHNGSISGGHQIVKLCTKL